jgi:hypothetical protein
MQNPVTFLEALDENSKVKTGMVKEVYMRYVYLSIFYASSEALQSEKPCCCRNLVWKLVDVSSGTRTGSMNPHVETSLRSQIAFKRRECDV